MYSDNHYLAEMAAPSRQAGGGKTLPGAGEKPADYINTACSTRRANSITTFALKRSRWQRLRR